MLVLGMQRQVTAIREQLSVLVAGLDPDDLPASYAPGLWRELDRLGRQVIAAKTLVARRVEDSRVWRAEGHASAAEYLSAHGGTSIGAARAELDTSKALPDLPATRAALLDGSVSAQQGSLIAEAARVNPAAEADLVGAASTESYKELKERSQRAKAAADPDPEATQQRIHRNRCLREHVDAEGAWNLHARGTKADGARVHAALAPLIEEIFTEDRRAGRRETPEARAFDALVRAVDGAGSTRGGRRVRREGMIRCDLAALRRGAVEGDEVCEVATTRHTRLEELDPLCDHHHDLKTHHGWALVAGTGGRPFVPPHDPRHPGRGSSARPAPDGTRWIALGDERRPDAIDDRTRTTGTDPPSAA